MELRRRKALVAVTAVGALLLVAPASGLHAQTSTKIAAPAARAGRTPSPEAEWQAAERARARAETVKRFKAYKASLDGLLPLYQDDPAGFKEMQTRIGEADRLIAEAVALELLARQPDPPATAPVFRGRGANGWSLAAAAQIQRFFIERFGRPLPVSAFGQTPLHDRLDFDHRNALDVALHPESVEGRALIDYLRGAGMPFLAFRSAVPGAATGAHIHIGAPSLPLRARLAP